MYMIVEVSQYVAVASFSEAWIEIFIPLPAFVPPGSPPSRRRGLKSILDNGIFKGYVVASFSEAWIEI